MPVQRRKGEVGGFELLLLLCALGCGILAAVYACSQFGLVGFLLGFPVGFFGVLVAFYIVALLFGLLEGLLTGIPLLPRCGNGKCKAGLLTDFGDYEPEQVDGEWGYFRCQCGILYLRKRKEGPVLEVLPDGEVKPYMVWRLFRE